MPAGAQPVDTVVGRWTELDLGVVGTALPVVTAPATVLSTTGSDVDPADPEVIGLAADLLATMRISPGCVGLAAPQVGVAQKIFCVDVSAHPSTRSHHGTFVLCNAQIVSAIGEERVREGCLSVPGLTGEVDRATRLVVHAQLPVTGQEVTLEAEAFEARAIQHEVDHCEGLVFLDRVASAHGVYPRRTYL